MSSRSFVPVRAVALGLALFGLTTTIHAATPTSVATEIDRLANEVEPDVVAWRRDIHANPELGNQEKRTAGLVAQHLKSLGYEVREGVAETGVVGLLKGEGGPGPVIDLRADMDALCAARSS